MDFSVDPFCGLLDNIMPGFEIADCMDFYGWLRNEGIVGDCLGLEGGLECVGWNVLLGLGMLDYVEVWIECFLLGLHYVDIICIYYLYIL